MRLVQVFIDLNVKNMNNVDVGFFLNKQLWIFIRNFEPVVKIFTILHRLK